MAALTRQRILETAVAMADRDGFEAVTLRRIAAELGVHVTSLYNHVPTREAVTDGIVQLLIEQARLPSAPVEWEEWVRRFFAGIGALAVAHPGAFTALQRRPVQGEQAAVSFEIALAAFRRAGLEPQDAYSATKATALTALVVGLERSLQVRGVIAETEMEQLSPESFPQLRSLDEIDDAAAVWDFSLETLVAGLRAQVDARAVTPAAAPAGG